MVPTQPCTAFIGDVVRSRHLNNQRQDAQKALRDMLTTINDDFSSAILAKFIITIGDEFQGLLLKASIIPEIIWRLEHSFTYSEIRIGIGHGNLDTSLQEYAIGTDGPVWHNARAAIIQAKIDNHLGGSFAGFGDTADLVLNGIARLTYHQRHSMTNRQSQVVALLHDGFKQSEAAEKLSVSPQAISKSVQTSGWEAYTEGVKGWKAMLQEFDTTEAN